MLIKKDLVIIAIIVSLFITFVVALTIISATVIWALWNWIIAGVFGAPDVTWFQALGISLILSIISTVIRSSISRR